MTREQLRSQSPSPGTVKISLGFYLGIMALILLVALAAFLGPPARPMINQHADPMPAAQVDSQVLVSAASNLYHSGTGCPYVHKNAAAMARQQAMQRGLAPCPYCIGNSAAHLTPTVVREQ